MAGLTPVRVVVADDHPIWISGVAADLGENFSVVASAGDAASAIAAIEKHHPDLVLSDLHMPEGGGRRVAMHCGARVVSTDLKDTNRIRSMAECACRNYRLMMQQQEQMTRQLRQ